MTNRFLSRTGLAVAGIFLFETVSAPWAEAGFWESRRNAVINQRKSETPLLLAALPAAPSPLAIFGSHASTGAASPAGRAADIPSRLGNVRSVPSSTQRTSVVLVQDAHRIDSAQINVAEILEHLNRTSGPLVVGVEGAAGAFHLAPLRQWADAEEREAVSGYMVKRGLVNGAELFGIKTIQEPLLWGVESPELYRENVQALQAALERQKELRTLFEAWDRELQPLRDRFLSPDARAWDRTVADYHAEKIGPAAYVQALAKNYPAPLPPETEKLLRVAELEKKTDLERMEAERREFLESLSARLTPESLAELMRDSAAYRLGELSGTDYYGRWRSLSRAHGLDWKSWSHMDRYVSAVALSEQIAPEKLFDEIAALQDAAALRLGRNAAERDILSLSEDLRLLRRLVDLNLVPSEWKTCSSRRAELANWLERKKEKGQSVSGSAEEGFALGAAMESFFAFYETADKRNEVMAANLLEKARSSGAKTAVLVAGGFHTVGLQIVLSAKGASPLVVSPKIGEIVSGTNYLDAFTVKRTPVERLLLGERLDLAPAAALAVKTLGDPSSTKLTDRLAALAKTAARISNTDGGTVQLPEGVSLSEIRREEDSVSAQVRVGDSAVALDVQVGAEEAEAEGSDQEMIVLQMGAETLTDTVTPARTTKGKALRALRRGGEFLTRVLPEAAAGVLLWGLGLGEFSFETAGFAAAVSVSLRAGWLGAVLWHGLGHSLVLGGFRFRRAVASLAGYVDFSWRSLAPGGAIFVPGLSARPPTLAVPQGTTSSRLRWAAAMGPLFSLGAAGLFGLLAWSGAPILPQGWEPVSVTWAALHLLALAASGSDIRALRNGDVSSLHCGVVSGVYRSPNPKRRIMPEGFRQGMNRAIRRTLHRGGQSGGEAVIGLKENGRMRLSFVAGKVAKEKDRRSELAGLMRGNEEMLAEEAEKEGIKSLETVVDIAHLRYGTNLAAPLAMNAHPHFSPTEEVEVFYMGSGKRDDPYEKHWEPADSDPRLKRVKTARGVSIGHNGDDNATDAYRESDRRVRVSNGEDAEWSEKMTGYVNPAQGDSPQIATRLDRWITQGSVERSLRLAVLTAGLKASATSGGEDLSPLVPSPAASKSWGELKVIEEFPRQLEGLSARAGQGARTLEDLFRAAGGTLDDRSTPELEEVVQFRQGTPLSALRDHLAKEAYAILEGMEWYSNSSESERAAANLFFADMFLKYFFTGDLRRAMVHLLRRADPTSTYGLAAASLSEPESIAWARHIQPFYLWASDDGKNAWGTSESTAFLSADRERGSPRYRLTLRNGEVAVFKRGRLTIDHMGEGRVADYDLASADFSKDERWMDTWEPSRLPVPSETEAEPAGRVRADYEMIPLTDQTIKESFNNLDSNNARSGRAMVRLLVERLASRRGKNLRSGAGLDLVIVGTEKGFDEGRQVAKVLEKLSSMAGRRLNVEVVYGAEFTRESLVSLKDRGFDENSVILGLSSSGQTANTFYTLDSLYEAWRGLVDQREGKGTADTRTPPHFLVSSHMDNPYTEQVLGQGLRDSDEFKERNFVTFPGLDPFHPSEAATVTHKATERVLKEVERLFAESLSLKAWKANGVTQRTVDALRKMIDNGDELNRRIVGLDADGNPVLRSRGEANGISEQVRRLAAKMESAFMETLWIAAGTALFVASTLSFHATPASLFFSLFPNGGIIFADQIPLASLLVALLTGWGLARRTGLGKWHPALMALGLTVFLAGGLLAGHGVTLLLDAGGALAGWGPMASGLGALPVGMDVSPVTMLNILSYVFFGWGLALGLRRLSGRPLWDRLGARTLVLSDPEHGVARLSAGRWRRMLNLRYGWMGIASINEASLGRMTHEEALNANVRGSIFLTGESRTTVDAATMNYKQLGGSPNGPGRAWRVGIGHQRAGEESPAYSEGYLSLAMNNDNPAGTDPDLLVLQDLVQDAPARDMAGMALTLAVAERMSRAKPVDFVIGQTSSEAKTSTTQQPFPPLSREIVAEVFDFPSQAAGEAPEERRETPSAASEPETIAIGKALPAQTGDAVKEKTSRPNPKVVMLQPAASSPAPESPPQEPETSVPAAPHRVFSLIRGPRVLKVLRTLILFTLLLPLAGSTPMFALPTATAVESLGNGGTITAVAEETLVRPSTPQAVKFVTLFSPKNGLVNVRSAPGADPLTSVPPGTSLEVLGPATQGFLPVRLGSVSGFVSESFTRSDESSARFSGSDVRLSEGVVRQFPRKNADSVRPVFEGTAVELARWKDEGKKEWALVDVGGQLGWVEASRSSSLGKILGTTEIVQKLVAEDVPPTDSFSSARSGSSLDPALAALLAAFVSGTAGTALDPLEKALAKRGRSLNGRDREALRLFLASFRKEAPALNDGLPVVNALGGFKRGTFRDSVERLLKDRRDVSSPVVFLVRSPQQKGAVLRRLKGEGIDFSAIRFVTIKTLLERGEARALEAGAYSVALEGLLRGSLNATEMANLTTVNILNSLYDPTEWVSSDGLSCTVMIIRFLSGGAVVSTLEKEKEIRKALAILRAA